MFIPPNDLARKTRESAPNSSQVRLQTSHLLIQHHVVQEAFGDSPNVYVVYYPDKRTLMIAPVSDEHFKNLHKASQHLLKDRNLKGDKSIALHEFLIDHQIDTTDRDLEFELLPGLGILQVNL